MFAGFETISKIPELKRRIYWSALMLAVYRIGCAVPTPGIDREAFREFFEKLESTIFGMFSMFSGGALERLSIFSLGIMPYISASIILQLLTVVWPYLEKLQKEGELGRRKITQYTRYGTVVLSAVQGIGISFWLESMHLGSVPVVASPGWSFRVMTVISLTAGTAFIMWLGEQVTERGIGNGISLIIFAGIVARMPSAVGSTVEYLKERVLGVFLIVAILGLMVGVIFAIVYMERAQRRVPVQYAKRVVGRRVYGGQSTHLPLKINTSGVIPPIFASSLLMFPITIANFVPKEWVEKHDFVGSLVESLSRGGWIYNVLYVVLIVFFCYFYTAIQFNPKDVADNMKKYGGFIPGIRPGQKTAEFIERILERITLIGAVYLSVICVLPTILMYRFNIPFYFGGTSLLIVVGVALDTVAQIETHMITRHYEGFLRKGRVKGRRG